MANTSDRSTQITVTGWAQKEAWDAGVLPPVEQLASDLWSIPIPMPNPLRYITVYLIETGDGPILIDSGWPNEEAWSALADGLAVAGREVADIRAVLVTHAHSDHLGLAGRIRQISDAWIGLHPADVPTIGRHFKRPDMAAQNREWLLSRGASKADTDAIRSRLDVLPDVASELVQPDRLIEDGSSPLGPKGRLRAIWTPGHTPGHLCFIDEARELVFTGDHVLPRVSPNIALNPGGTGNPLADFLGSLERMRHYDGSQMLPAHEYRFRGAGYRAKVLIEHHEARLSEICELINRSPGASTWEVAAALTWSRGWAALSGLMRRSALSETYAHLIYLHSVECAENRGLGVDSWWPVAGGY